MSVVGKAHFGNPSLNLAGIHRVIGDREVVTTFDSWDSFVNHVEQGEPQGTRSCSSETGDESFCSTKSLNEALKLARDGWSEVRCEVESIRDRVKADVIEQYGDLADEYSLVAGTLWDVAGAAVDVGRYLSGEYECMVAFADVEEPKSGKMVRILVDAIYSGGTGTQTVIKRGAVVVALVELLEMLGFATEVWTECNNTGATPALCHLVCLKNAESPLDVDALLFQIAHPSALRRLMFRSWETESERVRSAFGFGENSGGYGSGYGRGGRMTHQKDLDAHVALKAASYHDPVTLHPATWIKEIIDQLLTKREGAD